jgi:hypothetical protein
MAHHNDYYHHVLGSVRSGHIDVGTDKQCAILWDRLEGPQRYPHSMACTDIGAIWLVEAMLVEREEHINRIAELEDAATSAKERYDADLQSLRDELEKANEDAAGRAWNALSPAEREQAIRGAA